MQTLRSARRLARFSLLCLLGTLPLSRTGLAQVTATPARMHFQGRLAKPDGTPAADGNYTVRFSLFTALTGGTLKWTETLTPVAVHNGTFAALLGRNTAFPADLFQGDLFLEIKVGNDPPLTPRQPLVSVAYAMKANSVPDGSIGAAQIANGSITGNKFAANTFNPLTWLLGGNSGVSTGFLGTTDNNPLVFKVNGRQAMRYSDAQNTAFPGQEYRSINTLGGSEINRIDAGVVGATIAGGGMDFFTAADFPNRVTAEFGTIGGGMDNRADSFATISGGSHNIASGSFATISGGGRNVASNNGATVGGGSFNTASGDASTIAGGGTNFVSGLLATVGGGLNNVAAAEGATVVGGEVNAAFGLMATVAGGQFNTAAGDFSFAAGTRTRAAHKGVFVWGDSSTFAETVSTGDNQFLIRAIGGVGLAAGTYLDTGFGIAGREQNAGKIGYGLLTANTLDMVGAGSGARKVKIWAEGGTTFTGNVTATGFTSASDARYKQNITPFDNALEAVLQLRGVTYDWDRERWKEKGFEEGKQIGFLAQEVEKVLPELVRTDADGYKSVMYANVVPVLVEAVKTLSAKVETLQRDSGGKDRKIAELEARLDALASSLAELKASRQ